MAIAGPIVSVLLGVGFWLVLPWLPEGAAATRFVVAYLAMLNIVLVVFNLLPALPLDGGRVLRSLLALAMPFAKATRVAGAISKVIAFGLGLVGLLSLNVFLLAVAFFIFVAVSAETQMGRLEAVLRGVPARRIMNADVRWVLPETTVGELLQRMLADHHLSYPVLGEDGSVRGMVGLQAVQAQYPSLPVSRFLTAEVPTVAEGEDGVEVLRRMGHASLNRVLVVGPGGRVVGLITKGDLMRFIMVREAMADLRSEPRTPASPEPWAPTTTGVAAHRAG